MIVCLPQFVAFLPSGFEAEVLEMVCVGGRLIMYSQIRQNKEFIHVQLLYRETKEYTNNKLSLYDLLWRREFSHLCEMFQRKRTETRHRRAMRWPERL